MEDVRLSINALNEAVQAVSQTSKVYRSRLIGRVISVARLLRSDPILANAVRDLEHDQMSADAAKIERISNEILENVEETLYELGDLYLEHNSAWKRMVDELSETVARVSTSEPLAVVLKRVATGIDRRPAGFLHRDLEPFASNVIPKLVAGIEASDGKERREVLAYLERLKAYAEQSRQLDDFRRLCATGSVQGIVQRLQALLAEWETRIEKGPTGENWKLPDPNGLEEDLPMLASRVESFLAGRRSARLVLLRAKVYFEHFYWREARDVLEQEEARVQKAKSEGKEAKARRELELRRHLDRFIFQEGFFPITEASAARGRLDLLISEAGAAGIRPLVVEVKQAVRIDPDDISARDVREAIEAARREIPQYVGHLRARLGWEHIEPLVVVFHTAGEDVSMFEDSGTILINIGSRTPSQLR
ncbi:MAG: hypothetical protein QM831_31595 [Kofleriaceae bacterium]